MVAEFDDDTDLRKKIIVSGIKKISVLGVIKYHQIKHAVFDEIHYHPEVLKGLEVLHYHVEHNLPVEKELIFKLVPELFVHEINKLDYEDRKKFEKPRITYQRADGDLLDVDTAANIAANELDEVEKLIDKSMRMEMYLYEQTQDLHNFYAAKLSSEILDGGHVGVHEYLTLLEVMDEENMKDWEKRLMAEIRELRFINEDIKALQIHLREKKKEVHIPRWIQDPLLRQQYYQVMLFAEKYETIDIAQTNLLPTPATRGPDFEERLREVIDVDKMIAADNEQLKEIANQRLPLAMKDLSKKDDDLISKMS